MDFSPNVMLVGGPDVDARLELIHCLKDDFTFNVLGTKPDLHDRFSAEGIGYNSYQLNRGVNPFSDLQTVRELVRIFQQSMPDIVHTFDTKQGVWGRLAARLAGVPVVIATLPGLGSLYASNSLKTRLIRFVYQGLQMLACHLSDLTIFQNHADAFQFVDGGIVSEQKTSVILGSGIATDVFTPDRFSGVEREQIRRELGFQPNEIVVTMISRVIRSKGVLEFITAAQDIHSLHPDVRFLLIGSEDEESVDRLSEAELNQLNHAEAITWPGPRRDIPAVLAASNIFILPSAYREGIPRVLMEAASMGLPIVTTDSPGCNEVVENDVNGFLVPVSDSAALTEAILSLIEKPELQKRFGQISRQRAVEQFNLAIIAEQTRMVYQQLLVGKGLLQNEKIL